MTTRELLIQEINQASEEVLLMMLRYLQSERDWRRSRQSTKTVKASGPYADYWNQFVGALAEETWERPPQGNWEQRPAW
ncbi:MAG: hypothetical protein U0350_47705 [Caldilineaceae bacterium]